nr:zinc knuckle CX2CX4HX4C [Tanacetum cinerariifolium]GEZ66360.1 zinc knuckle CX2CX4HX4C [Tanacetum cinerariifolium]
MKILLLKLVSTFPCELRTSPRVPLNLYNWDTALFQSFNVTLHDYYWSSLELFLDRNASNVLVNMHMSSLVNEVLVHNIDDVAALFIVPLNSIKEIDDFTKDMEVGKQDLWLEVTREARSRITDIISNRWDALLNMQKSAPIVDDSPSVVEKVSICFEHTLYGYFIGKRIAFLVVEYYARNNWAKHGIKGIMMNTKGFFFIKFDSQAGLDAVLEGGPWLLRNSPIILKKRSMEKRMLKKELTRILKWVKLHDVPIHVFEEDEISLIATFTGKP